jgi:hypothetical protein
MIASGKMDKINYWGCGETPHPVCPAMNFYDFSLRLCDFAAPK